MNDLDQLLLLDQRALEAAVSARNVVEGVDITNAPSGVSQRLTEQATNQPSILDHQTNRFGWVDRDPGNICKPLAKPKPLPVCTCPPPSRHHFGGQDPSIDLEARVLRCRTCLQPIDDLCKRRHVVHLRGLLHLLNNHPEMVDLEDAKDAGFIYEQPAQKI